eukprot:7389862-Prymnesium_polylepis.1
MPGRPFSDMRSLKPRAVDLAHVREENQRLRDVNRMNSEALKEHSKLFKTFQNAGVCVALCHACHALAHRHARIKVAEAKGVEEEEMDDD